MTDLTPYRAGVQRALDAVYVPAPALPSLIRAAVLDAPARQRRPGPALAAVAAVLLAALAVGTVVWGRAALSRSHVAATAPPPFAAPGPLTAPAAQVAWVVGGVEAAGIDPSGHQVGSIKGAFGPYLSYRSGDGKTVVAIDGADIRVHDAGSGALLATVARPAAGVGDAAFSPDGRYLALLTTDVPEHVQLLDLAQGKLASDLALANASERYHGFITFHPDAGYPELFVISHVASGPQLIVLGYVHGNLQLIRESGISMPSCGDPAPLTSHMLADGRTLAVFCHESGQLSLVDTQRLTAAHVDTGQQNPFWFSPIYSPDGTKLYLHDIFSETVTVVDLESRKVGDPVKITVPASLAQKLAGWFVTEAEAGGIADTQPISPDGSLLYLAEPNGLVVMSTRSMTPTQVLLYGRKVTDVWVSGDGAHVYALVDGRLAILADRRAPVEANVSAGGFLSAAHG